VKRILLFTICISVLLVSLVASPVLAASHGNGPSTYTPAYYDGKLFTISFMELSPKAATATELHNNSKNIVYQSDQAVAEGFNFINVLNAIQKDGFNPLWEEWQITFLTIDPIQYFSDNEILAAAAAGNISLTDTEGMYICAVVGSKN